MEIFPIDDVNIEEIQLYEEMINLFTMFNGRIFCPLSALTMIKFDLIQTNKLWKL